MSCSVQGNYANYHIGAVFHCACNSTSDPTPHFITASSADHGTRYDSLFSNHNIDNPIGAGHFYDSISTCYGISFFITERKTHYRELDRHVFSPLASLQPAETPNNFLNFFHRFRILVYQNPSNSIHYPNALMHMRKDAPKLPDLIRTFFADIDSLNDSVDELETLVDNTIRDSFRKGPEAVTEHYTYHFEAVLDVVMSVWNKILNENPQNVLDGIRNLPIEELQETRAQNIIRLRGFLIGEGKDEELTAIRDIVFNQIIKNEPIIERIYGLFGRRPVLMKRIDEIKQGAGEISEMLESGTINTVKCCPTVWKLLEKYVLK